MVNDVTFYVLTFLTTIVAGVVVFFGATFAARLRNRVLLLVTIPVLFVYIGLCVIQPSSWLLSDIMVLLTAILVGSLLLLVTIYSMYVGVIAFETKFYTLILYPAVIGLWSFSYFNAKDIG